MSPNYTGLLPVEIPLSWESRNFTISPSAHSLQEGVSSRFNATAASVVIASLLVVHSISLISKSNRWFKRTEYRPARPDIQTTSTRPVVISLITSIVDTVRMLWSPKSLLLSCTSTNGKQSSTRLDLATESVYIVQGKEYITRLWRVSSNSRALALHAFLLKRWFAMPQTMVDKYLADDSGYGPKPHQQSTIEPHNRTDRLSFLVFKDVLSGPDTTSLCDRFVARFCNKLGDASTDTSWTSHNDLVAFFQDAVSMANTQSLWGTRLTAETNFCGDLSTLLKNLHYFTYKLPRWLVPKTFASRDCLLQGLLRWQSFGNSSEQTVQPWEQDGYDAMQLGSKRIRKWQTEFLHMDGGDAEALASVHLTFAWAANVNLGPAVFWAVLEVFRDTSLLEQVRSRLPLGLSVTEVSSFLGDAQNRERICSDPLLQSIFAETLRLRVCAFVVRRFPHDAVDLHGWQVPRDQLCLVSSHLAHMHGDGWNTDGGQQPLDRFWASRFLVPSQRNVSASEATDPPFSRGEEPQNGSTGDPWAFSLRGLEGVWMPFGGGPRACPGRHLTKHHMIVTMAAMVMLFDMDIRASEKALRMGDGNHGFGTLLPVGKIPFRIRHRR